MRNFSLRLPYLIYLSIASALIGVLIAPNVRGMPPQASAQDMMLHEMMHGEIEVSAEDAPRVALTVTEDSMDGWNIVLETEGFEFTPEAVNGEHVPGTGHAHVYLNEVKLARLYGPYFHLPDLPPGEHELSVSLSANDHAYFVVDGERVEARVTVTQD